MGKFDRYKGKLNFDVNGEHFETEFLVSDRMEITSIQDIRGVADKYNKMLEFCRKVIKRSYPTETEEDINAFLALNFEAFVEELMITSGIAKRVDFEKARDEVTKKASLQ
jgi:hypothetical protein